MNKRLIRVLILSLVVSLVSTGCARKDKDNKEAKKEEYIPVETMTVTTGEIYDEAIFVGRIYSEKDFPVVSAFPGRISSIDVNLGDEVEEGEVLFSIQNEEIERKEQMAKKALDAGNAQMDRTISEMKSMNPQGQLENQSNQTEIPTDKVEPNLNMQNSAQIQMEMQGEIEELNMAYEQAKIALDSLNVKSPSKGIVSYMNIREGEIATNSSPTMIISNLDRVYLETFITDRIVDKVNKGDEVLVDIPSFSIEDYKCSIDEISVGPSMENGMYRIRVFIENDDHKIRPGAFGKVRIKLDKREKAVVIPSDAVIDKNGEKVIYIVEDGVAVEKKISLGLDTGEKVEITKGLNGGEKLIIKGQNYVQDGIQVKVVGGDE
jgi:RND family efflux transporter MFP subunit